MSDVFVNDCLEPCSKRDDASQGDPPCMINSLNCMVSHLSLCVVQSLLQLSGQEAALAALLLQLLLNILDTGFL